VSDEELISLYREAQDAGRNATQHAPSDPAEKALCCELDIDVFDRDMLEQCWSRCSSRCTNGRGRMRQADPRG
jgi:hypothetical protein